MKILKFTGILLLIFIKINCAEKAESIELSDPKAKILLGPLLQQIRLCCDDKDFQDVLNDLNSMPDDIEINTLLQMQHRALEIRELLFQSLLNKNLNDTVKLIFELRNNYGLPLDMILNIGLPLSSVGREFFDKVEAKCREILDQELFKQKGKKKTARKNLKKNLFKKLYSAVINGDAKLAQDLIEQGAGLAGKNGQKLLCESIKRSFYEVTEILLKHVNPNFSGNLGITPLHIAAGPCEEKDIPARSKILALLLNYINENYLNAKTATHGYTPLQVAIAHGNLEFVKILLKKGADCQVQNFAGKSAVEVAAKNNNLPIFKVVFHARDNILHSKDLLSTIKNCIDIAKEYGHKEIVGFLESLNYEK